MSLAHELTERGFIHQISGPSLEEIIDKEQRTIYTGIDPSADSAHVGNMVIWMLMRHLAQAGHKIVFLVGGGTGMIGDPKPDAERELKDQAMVEQNVAGLKAQAEKFFAGLEIEFVNNLEWLGKLRLIDFLRDIGKHYTVNELIKKDAIATRLSSDTGLSYTEFAYPLLQGYDYLQLFDTKNCTVQVGGSDQWGNIVSGVELVRRKKQVEVYAVTIPLIIDKGTGKKFGKSEGNAVWLDPVKTSPYEFYQFWLNVSDDSVVEHLKRFTFLSLKEISEIEKEHAADFSSRVAQKALAQAVTALVHGKEAAEQAVRVTEALFGEVAFSALGSDELAVVKASAPHAEVADDTSLVDVLVVSGLASSKREARSFIEGGGVEVNREKVSDVAAVVAKEKDGSCVLVKRGKKLYATVTLK